MQNQKQKRIYEVKLGQIFLALLIAAIALTVVFELGVWAGKRKVIKAQLEAERQDDVLMKPIRKVSTEAKLPDRVSPKPQEHLETVEPEPVRKDETQPGPAEEVTTEAKLPGEPLPAQSEETLIVEEELEYTVQVGAFSSLQNAESLVAMLKSYEYESWLKPELVAEKTLYFVFIGRFRTEQEADQLGRSVRDNLSYITDYRVKKMQE